MGSTTDLRRPAWPAVSIALAVLFTVVAGRAGTRPVTLEVRARALQPGEPVRIVAVAPESLTSLSGSFLDRELTFQAVDPGGERRVWSAWAVISLDKEPGTAVIEVQGATSDDRSAGSTLAVTIAEKSFPVENLTVSSRYVEPPPETRERIARERRRVAAIYATRTPSALDENPFLRPLEGGPTSVFGTRRLFNGKPRSPHPGLDLRASSGTPVDCSGPGTVVLAEDLYYSGKIVIVDHGGGLFTLYAHLSRIDVGEGDMVRAGQTLGLSGSTGRVTGPHLHWGAKIGDVPFDPRALLEPELFR